MKKNFLKKYYSELIGIVVGALGGFLYWKFIGCSSGSCPITSSPLISTIWGAVMGWLVVGIFKNKKKQDD